MNDTELDDLLDTWKTPAPSASMRARLQAAAARPERRFFAAWRLVLASAAAVAFAVLLANSSALSQMISPPPYTVESEVIVHPAFATGCFGLGGPCLAYSRPQHTLMWSYNVEGSEVVATWSDPGEPLESLLWEAKLAVFSTVDRVHAILAPPVLPEDGNHAVFHATTEGEWVIGEKDALVNSGCRPVSRRGEVIGEETVLGYPTVIARFEGRARLTLWMAPQLSCFALRGTVEQQQPDGSWTLLSEKKAMKVSVRK
ncbi:MAG TPA: hypothetical protein VKY31_10950 [Terriglobia bacterium]|nr:hypothetical protein [Terriglobia bacterium]